MAAREILWACSQKLYDLQLKKEPMNGKQTLHDLVLMLSWYKDISSVPFNRYIQVTYYYMIIGYTG
ncbi:MAG TPA: hypothetical protein VJU13_02430 [Candidatus Nitrosocosmicus sp.]|nr:hypothetical protein [Candidatus Nitrosocosmicus sp.]